MNTDETIYLSPDIEIILQAITKILSKQQIELVLLRSLVPLVADILAFQSLSPIDKQNGQWLLDTKLSLIEQTISVYKTTFGINPPQEPEWDISKTRDVVLAVLNELTQQLESISQQ